MRIRERRARDRAGEARFGAGGDEKQRSGTRRRSRRGRARPLSPPLGRSGAAPAPCARGPPASRQPAAADLPFPALPSRWPKLPLVLGGRPWRASAARGPRQRASLQLRRPEFWVGVRRLHQSGLQVPGLRAAAGREGNWGQLSPVGSSVKGPAPPGAAAAAGRARPEQCSGRGSQRRDPDTPLLEPRLEAEARHPLGYRRGPGRAALESSSPQRV